MHESDTTEDTDSDDSSVLSTSSATDYDSSDGSEMDLKKNYRPIGEYMQNRREMTRQMFHTIKGRGLKKIVPKSLRVSSGASLHMLASILFCRQSR